MDGDLDVAYTGRDTGEVFWHQNLDNQGSFGPAISVATNRPGESSIAAQDIDQDGDLDLAAGFSGSMYLYENVDGRGTFVEAVKLAGDRAAFLDVDADGDLDVVTAWRNQQPSSTVSWYANLDGKFSFGTAESHYDHALGDLVAVDVNGDGLMDVAAVADRWSEALLFPNDGSGVLAPVEIGVPDCAVCFGGSVVAGDLDNDGDQDIISSGVGPAPAMVLLNEDQGRAFEMIDSGDDFAPSTLGMALSDIDNDGDLDLVAAPGVGQKLAWYENHGDGGFGKEQVIADSTEQPIVADLEIGDVNGDGREDLIVVGFSNAVFWYERVEGNVPFRFGGWIKESDTVQAEFVRFTDLDGDGDQDIVTASGTNRAVAWYENRDGRGTFSSQRILFYAFGAPDDFAIGDVDADGDVDFAYSESGFVYWVENQDGETFQHSRLDGVQAGSPEIDLSDLDGDADLDLVVTQYSQRQVVWLENVGGPMPFSTPQFVSNIVRSPRGSTVVGDFDGNGQGGIVFFDAEDRVLKHAALHTDRRRFLVTPIDPFDNLRALYGVDLDGNGHLEVIVIRHGEDPIHLVMAEGFFQRGLRIGLPGEILSAVTSADLDGDGDGDLLAYSRYERTRATVWLENDDGVLRRAHYLADEHPGELAVADVDADGDVDVLAADLVTWYRNDVAPLPGDHDGNGTVDIRDVDRLASHIHERGGAFDDYRRDSPFDLSGNRAIDLADLDYLLREILMTVPGDANLDGVFDSSDLVAVFANGKYVAARTDQTLAAWSDGDWNADGVFDSGDLVLAFQAGHYFSAASNSTAEAASVIDWLLADDDDEPG